LMFLACGAWCAHSGSFAALLALSYCTRFFAKYKAHKTRKTCGNAWESELLDGHREEANRLFPTNVITATDVSHFLQP
jgi:hypothetical protein